MPLVAPADTFRHQICLCCTLCLCQLPAQHALIALLACLRVCWAHGTRRTPCNQPKGCSKQACKSRYKTCSPGSRPAPLDVHLHQDVTALARLAVEAVHPLLRRLAGQGGRRRLPRRLQLQGGERMGAQASSASDPGKSPGIQGMASQVAAHPIGQEGCRRGASAADSCRKAGRREASPSAAGPR